MAFTLLAVGLLSLAGLAATSMQMVRGGGAQTLAAAVAQSRFDSLSSVPCDAIAPATGGTARFGTSTTRGVTETWTAQRVSNGNMVQLTNVIRVRGRTAVYRYEGQRACR